MNKPLLSESRAEYLELMQAWLTGSLWHDETCAPFAARGYIPAQRECGLDWPAEALTMIGLKRLMNLRQLTQSVLSEGIPGDFIETGVWRGGACIMMRAILFAYGVSDRRVWVADSFAGLPEGDAAKYPHDAGSDFHTFEQLAIALHEVQRNFAHFGFLDDQTVFLPGWFKDTLPKAPISQLALLRLDGDMYESTIDALDHLYPKLAPGGFVIIDDYHVVPGCSAAVHDYCQRHGICPELIEIDGVGVYWRKGTHIAQPNVLKAQGVNADYALTERIMHATAALRKEAIHRLERELTRRDAEIARRDAEIARRDAEIARRDAEIARRDAEIAQRDAELATMCASWSWRMTRPLRDFVNWARPFLSGKQ